MKRYIQHKTNKSLLYFIKVSFPFSFDQELKTFLLIVEVAQSSDDINKALTGPKLFAIGRNNHVTRLDLLLVTNYKMACVVNCAMAPMHGERETLCCKC